MNDTAERVQLSQDQLVRIADTLKRIRGGLGRLASAPTPEPAHIFTPKMQDAK